MEMENLDYRQNKQTTKKKAHSHCTQTHTQKSMMVGTALMDFLSSLTKTQWRK
jgi:hypothetical protein